MIEKGPDAKQVMNDSYGAIGSRLPEHIFGKQNNQFLFVVALPFSRISADRLFAILRRTCGCEAE